MEVLFVPVAARGPTETPIPEAILSPRLTAPEEAIQRRGRIEVPHDPLTGCRPASAAEVQNVDRAS